MDTRVFHLRSFLSYQLRQPMWKCDTTCLWEAFLLLEFYGMSDCVCVQWLCHVWLCVTPRTAVHQALLSMEFPRQEYWSGLPLPTPGGLLGPGIEPKSLASPALAHRLFITSATWGAQRRWDVGVWTLDYILGVAILAKLIAHVACNSLQPTRLLCPWDFSGKNTGGGCHFLLQGIFLTQGSNPHLQCLLHCRNILYPLSHQGTQKLYIETIIPMW